MTNEQYYIASALTKEFELEFPESANGTYVNVGQMRKVIDRAFKRVVRELKDENK